MARRADCPQWAMLTLNSNRQHQAFLSHDYLRKLKQDLAEVEAQVEAETRYEPDPDAPPPDADDAPQSA